MDLLRDEVSHTSQLEIEASLGNINVAITVFFSLLDYETEVLY